MSQRMAHLTALLALLLSCGWVIRRWRVTWYTPRNNHAAISGVLVWRRTGARSSAQSGSPGRVNGRSALFNASQVVEQWHSTMPGHITDSGKS